MIFYAKTDKEFLWPCKAREAFRIIIPPRCFGVARYTFLMKHCFNYST